MIVEWTAEPDEACGGQRPDADDVSLIHGALNYMAQGLVVYNAKSELVLHSATYRSIYRLDAKDLTKGLPIDDVIKLQARALGLCDKGMAEFATPFADPSVNSWSAIRRLPDGRSIQMSRRQMGGGFFVVTHEDISERVRMEDEIRHAANHDGLTGLANRSSFLEQLEQALFRVRRGDRIALLTIDLDGFKNVNDTHGHPVGDAVLKEVARRLRTTTRDTDIVARFGGDEFGVIQVPALDPGAAERLATRIVESLGAPYFVDDLALYIGASIGIAMTEEGFGESSALMQNSDLALYRAKRAGRGCWRFFDDQFDRSMRRKCETERKMRQALANDAFQIHYQPIVNVEQGRVESVEALLRWQDGGTCISPGEFIPVAEECGLIVPLGDWILRRACSDAAQWSTPRSVAVNVSPLQFKSGNLIQSIEGALEHSGLAPERLKIEITESLLLDDSNDVVAALGAIRRLGVRIALDDFGTGYSSLKYLTSFAFSKLKIDRSFVTGSPVTPKNLAVIKAATALGRDLGMKTIVEGVETREQLDALRALGCNYVQGFYFARPTPPVELEDVIARAESLCDASLWSALRNAMRRLRLARRERMASQAA